MPLIVVVGGPCSGKTTIANKLKEFIEKEKGKKVIHINEELVGVNKIEFYKDSTVEKIIRAKLKSNVEKNLDDKTFVIIDSLNYIKGYRYELYCLVRTYMTRHCVVYCKTDLEICLKLNNNSVYPEDLLKDLYSRMEEPNPHSIFLLIKDRWDNPMVQINFGEEINYEGIYSNLIEGKKPRDPVSTKNDNAFDSNFLFELDSTCQNIINEILSAQLNSIVESVKISEHNFIYLKKNFSAIELKKLKQEYIKVSKLHPPKNKDEMIKTFVEYINTVQDRY